jgi:RimJ/RimL family protein N-acetyltransferase
VEGIILIKITKDYEMIRKMLFDDKELYERISNDFTTPERWHPEKSEWVGWFEDGECLALLSAHEESAVCFIIHIHIPAKNRGKKSFEMGNGLLEWLIKKSDKRFVKINAKIPVINRDVIKFAEKNGFEKEGIDKKSYIKNGKYHDQVCMGRIIR